MIRTILWSAAAVTSLATANIACAQTASQPVEDKDPARADADDSDEILVTAQRREQSLQDVPMSVTAISGDTLAKAAIVNSQDLTTVTPGLIFARSSVNAQPTIRGIGTRNGGPGDEPNVATYIDGVYQAEQYGNFQEFTNVERLEVLKGPQGTLFGRNATGGAINIITKRASFTPTGDVSITYGSFDYTKAAAYVSGPVIGEKLAASISAYAITEDNYYFNVFRNEKNGDRQAYAARLKLLFTPVEGVEFQLNGMYAYSDDNNIYDGTPIAGNSIARRTANPTNIPLDILIPSKPWTTSGNIQPFSTVRQRQLDFHADIDVGFATLSGLASYSRSANVQRFDFDVTPFYLSDLSQNYQNQSTNQELVLTGASGSPLEWLVGASAFQGWATLANTTRSSPTTSVLTLSGQGTDAYAAFAEGTYAIGDKLFLTAGLRYSSDTKNARNGPTTTGVVTRGSKTWTNLAPRAIARYEFAQNSNVYFSYTEGFKTGTFNPTTAAGTITPANPETVQSYEAGFKVEPVRNIRLTGAVFQSDYKDLQTSLTVLQPNGALASFLQNASSARIRGLEATADVRIGALKLNAGLSVLDSEIGNFPNAAANRPFLFNGMPAGNTSGSADVTGNDLIRAPGTTFNFGANYTAQLPGGELTVAGNAYFSSHYYYDLINRVQQPAYEVINASITYQMHNGFRITGFIQNLTNAEYAIALVGSVFGDSAQLNKPRWGGVTVGFSF